MTRIQGKAPERAEANVIIIVHFLVDDQNTKDCFPGISIEGGEMPKNLQYWAFEKKYKAKTEL